MAKRGLYVGRFQPFHLGHLDVVKEALRTVEELILVIGSAQYSHTVRDPFTAGERLFMIRETLREAQIEDSRAWIVPVPDVHLHMMWVSSVEGYTPSFDTVFTNEPLTQRLFKEAGYAVKAVPFFERSTYSSTLIREKITQGKAWEGYVPRAVASFIKEIDGIGRLRDLAKSDKAQ